MDTIGVICEPDHPVFGRAAERLAARGFDVEFLPVGEPIDPASIESLDALANTALTRRSLAGLRAADRAGVETWNGFGATAALASRLVALEALEAVGCLVPRVWSTPPDVDHDARGRFRWAGLGPTGGQIHLERVAVDPLVHRYYAIDDGVETHVQALTLQSSISGRERLLGETDVDVELAARVRELLDAFDVRTVAVDFVRGEEGFYAVDARPTPDFFEADMDRHVADSMASLMTIGA